MLGSPISLFLAIKVLYDEMFKIMHNDGHFYG
jgi:hypothetical protein